MPCTCTTKSSQSFAPQNLTSIHPFWFRRGRRCGHLNFGGCHSAISDPRKIFAPEKSHSSDNQLDGFMMFYALPIRCGLQGCWYDDVFTVPGVIFFWAQEDVESLTTASSFGCSGRRGVLAGELSVGSVGSVGSVCGSVAGSAMRSVMPRTSRKARDHLVYDLRVLHRAGIQRKSLSISVNWHSQRILFWPHSFPNKTILHFTLRSSSITSRC